MERAPVDEEAPKDPGASQQHQTFSEKDFEGTLNLLLIALSNLSATSTAIPFKHNNDTSSAVSSLNLN
jgi:hypothetical protein